MNNLKIYDICNFAMFCELIENLVNESIDHGGDAGGAYFINKKELILCLHDLFRFLRVDEKVTIIYDGYIKIDIKR